MYALGFLVDSRVSQLDTKVTLSAYIYISRQSCRNPVLMVIESDDRSR